jgi:hypothetical protein
MSSYQPLADFLSTQKTDRCEATFAQVERILGRALPKSAYSYNAWWANQTGRGHSQTRGWRSVGWKTAAVDLERKRVSFERERAAATRTSEADDHRAETERLFHEAAELTGENNRDALILAGLRALIAHEVASGIAKLGGSMPDFEAAPRERPWA